MPADFNIARLKPILRSDFLFGVGTAAYQIEGAVDEDGRSASIWDTFCREPGRIHNSDTGDTACDHYHRWREDIGLLRELGVDAYRFSISWSRVLPDESGAINEKGIAFYRSLIDELRAAGIRPMVTLHHWDLPQYLQAKGGWQNRETATRLAEFTESVAMALGDSVDFYTTINEPWCIAFLGHRHGIHAPGIKDEDATFRVAHHLLLAHGLSTRTLRRCAPHADVGIVLNGGPSIPATQSTEDIDAAKRAETEQIHLFARPLLKKEYPKELADKVDEWIMPGDMGIISEPCDYLGWNYYTRNRVRAGANGLAVTVPADDCAVTEMGWEIYPQGIEEILTTLRKTYELPPLYITENGAAFADHLEGSEVHDHDRISYLNDHLKVVAKLVDEGYDIRGYLCWSLMDNFEWAEGYSKRFGLVHVDYDSQKRTLKDSGKAIAKLMADRNILRNN